MFSLYNIIDLFFLSIPLIVGYQASYRMVMNFRQRHRRKTPISLYALHAIIAVSAFLFALYYFHSLQN